MTRSNPEGAASPAETAGRRLADVYLDLLAGEGYRPTLERDESRPHLATLYFKSEGIRVSLRLDEEDPGYLHLAVGYAIVDVEPGDPHLFLAANDVNGRARAVKVVVHSGDLNVSFHYEAFVDTRPSPAVLERALFQLRRAADDYFAQLERRAGPKAKA